MVASPADLPVSGRAGCVSAERRRWRASHPGNQTYVDQGVAGAAGIHPLPIGKPCSTGWGHRSSGSPPVRACSRPPSRRRRCRSPPARRRCALRATSSTRRRGIRPGGSAPSVGGPRPVGVVTGTVAAVLRPQRRRLWPTRPLISARRDGRRLTRTRRRAPATAPPAEASHPCQVAPAAVRRVAPAAVRAAVRRVAPAAVVRVGGRFCRMSRRGVWMIVVRVR